MKYTIVLRRSPTLLETFDDEEMEFYVANPDKDFPDLTTAVRAARVEAAMADNPDFMDVLRQRGVNVVGSVNIRSDNYDVVMVFEGVHKPIFGWEPELSRFRGY